MKKLLASIFLGLLAITATSCDNAGKLTTTLPTKMSDVDLAKQYFDVPATDIDHYFSNKVRFSDTGINVTKDKNGKLAGDFIKEGVAKLAIQSVTDGDTAVFHLNKGTTNDTYTVKNKSYDYLTIRYLGIDTPESTSSIDPWGKKASNYGKELLKNAEGIIVDAKDLPSEADKGYIDRIDTNGTRWLGLVWYCPKGGDPEDLTQYRSYQLDMIEECYTFATSVSSERIIYTADKEKEPVLYKRYEKVDGVARYGSINMKELFFEAGDRMQRTGRKIRVQGEIDDGFDYSKTPISLSITDALKDIDTYILRGTFVELKGVITRFVGNNFYFEDENGSALYVYMGIDGNSINKMFNQGDTIKIRGRLCSYGGQYQMSGIVFKKETFIKVTKEDEIIPMPEPIELTGNETLDELLALTGKLVKARITIADKGVGNPSKDGSFSISSTTIIDGHAKPVYSGDNSLQVRLNGSLVPTYSRDDFEAGRTYDVTAIMGLYFNEDYQNAELMANPKAYYSYQLVVGNRLVNGEVLNEIVEVN